MKSAAKLFVFASLLAIFIYTFNISESSATYKAGCDAYMYVANNSLFEINVFIDNVGVGNVLMGKTKTFTYTRVSENPKRVKVKCDYQDPDFIDPKSIYFVTKTAVECGQTDTVYFGIQK
jgi:hypothetical protein